MATFWGDILRLLAHTGFQTAGGIGKELVGSYLKPGMEVRETAGKNLLDVLSTQTGAPAEAAAETLKSRFGVEWPRATGTGPGGSSELLGPGGVKLTAPGTTPLAELAPGYEAQKSLIRGVPSLDKLKAGLFQTLSPEEQKTAAFPKETSLQAARENLMATIFSREGVAKDSLAERQRAAKATEDLRRDMLTQQHDRLLSETDYKREQIKSRNKMIDIIGGAKRTVEEQKYADKLTKALENVTLYQDDPDKAYSHAQNFNSILAVAAKKFPDTIGDEYTPFRLTPRVEGRIWDTKPTITPGVKEEGGKIGKGPTPPEFPKKVPLPEGGEAIKTEQFSLKTGKPLYKFPDGTLRSY